MNDPNWQTPNGKSNTHTHQPVVLQIIKHCRDHNDFLFLSTHFLRNRLGFLLLPLLLQLLLQYQQEETMDQEVK